MGNINCVSEEDRDGGNRRAKKPGDQEAKTATFHPPSETHS
jgi:hypothetical protein